MTVEEMAKQLGVSSKSTVSRALSGKGRISEETRERIRSFARAAGGWKENGVAPLQKATGNIAVVNPDGTPGQQQYSIFSGMSSGCQRGGNADGLSGNDYDWFCKRLLCSSGAGRKKQGGRR